MEWLSQHPRPGIYLRQVDIEGVHSKFIEHHRAVLTEMLDLALPPGAADPAQSGVSHFAARFGFLDKPVRIRFRVLDSRIELPAGLTCADISLDADSFSRLAAPIRRAFITESETNFLAFPPAAHSIVIFGSGYGWDALAKARWLSRCSLLYWGDIDTHGFAILDSLRERFERVESFLMDKITLLSHEKLWGSETDQVMGATAMRRSKLLIFLELKTRCRSRTELPKFAVARPLTASMIRTSRGDFHERSKRARSRFRLACQAGGRSHCLRCR